MKKEFKASNLELGNSFLLTTTKMYCEVIEIKKIIDEDNIIVTIWFDNDKFEDIEINTKNIKNVFLLPEQKEIFKKL